MPSADSCSNSDLDCGSTVRYTLQCEYPERPDFGPDKFGAFFGDVELGRIVQEEHGDPLPSTSAATPTPPPLLHPFTSASHFTPVGSLYAGSATASDQSSSSASQYDKGSPQYVRSASYVAEHPTYGSEYAELNVDPDLRRSIRTGPEQQQQQQHRAPPDYVRISAVLLVIAPPCAGVALYWALQAKKHMKRGQNGKAWQLSNKAFYILLLGLLCFLVIILSFSIAKLVLQFSRNRDNSRPGLKANAAEINNEWADRLFNSTQITKKLRDHKVLIYNILPSSSTPTAPTNHHSPSSSSTIATAAPMTELQKQRGGNKLSKLTQQTSNAVQRTSPSKVKSGFDNVFQGLLPMRNTNTEGAIPETKLDALNGDTVNSQVPKVSRDLFSPSGRSRTSTTTEITRIEQSNFDTFLRNLPQLPLKTTTIAPRPQDGVPIDSEQAASGLPRQMRHRRNVRQRPRGRRKQTRLTSQ